MPELPEVQTVVNDLREAGLPGRRILAVRVNRPQTVAPLSPTDFSRRLEGRIFEEIGRYGKYIHFKMSGGGSLLAHLRMTGQFDLGRPGTDDEADPHDRVMFSLDDGRRLRFHDTRAFGRLIFTGHPDEILGRLGPDALDASFSPELFYQRLQKHRRQIKALLLDQSFIAGLGNIYCDEALFVTGIHPLRCSNTIDRQKARELLETLRSVLQTALKNRGTSLGEGETNYLSAGRRGENRSLLKVYGRAGEPCPRCGATIEKIYVAQRGTHFCPVCQADYTK